MDKVFLEKCIADGLTYRQIAALASCSQAKVGYWMNKHGLLGNRQVKRRASHWHEARASGQKYLVKSCRRHGSTEFVLEASGFYRCKKCRAAGVAKRRRVVKRKLVAEAGGRCVLCGYDRSPAALHFHHLDPQQKAFGLGIRGITRGIAKLREEAKKCVLLCANCHAEVEWDMRELPLELAAAVAPS